MKINKIYKPFLNSKERYSILYGGAGSGKSYVIAQKILLRVIKEPEHRFLVVRKVARTLRASVFQLFRDIIADEGIADRFKINKTDMTIEFLDNGSTILFFGLDDVEKLKSIAGITSIWIEEASEITSNDFDQIDLRLRSDKEELYMQIILSFNPISSYHWIKKRFFDNSIGDLFVQRTTYLDNRFLPSEYIKVFENLKITNPSYYEIYALGKWGHVEGVIYKDIEIVDRMIDYFEDEMIGLDFGYNHPYAIVHVRINGRDLYVDEILYETEMENKRVIDKIDSDFSFIRDLMIYADSARADLISEYVSAGYRIQKANKSVFDGINTVQSFKIHVTSRSKNLLREFELYSWKKDKNDNFIDEPIKQNDDALDALRYALTPYIKKTGKTVSFKLEWL